jgi:hypothetical protein
MVWPIKDWASGIAADVRWGEWASQGTRDICMPESASNSGNTWMLCDLERAAAISLEPFANGSGLHFWSRLPGSSGRTKPDETVLLTQPWSKTRMSQQTADKLVEFRLYGGIRAHANSAQRGESR